VETEILSILCTKLMFQTINIHSNMATRKFNISLKWSRNIKYWNCFNGEEFVLTLLFEL